LNISYQKSCKPESDAFFKITDASGAGVAQVVRTDEQEVISVNLPPGKYTVETVHPVSFKGHSLIWKIPA
jgi:uncharacterized surface anchored protein